MYKDFPGFLPKMQNLEILDGIRGRFLGTGNYELGYGGAAQSCCAFNEAFLFGSDPGLQALLFSRPPLTLLYACHEIFPACH